MDGNVLRPNPGGRAPPYKPPCLMTGNPLIRAEDLHKHYRDGEGRELHILRGTSLSVEAGGLASIMGASGAGKSTLLHLLGALDTPDRGTIHIAGVDVQSLDEEAAARFRNETIGFVFQFHHLLMDFSTLENVMMPIWIREGKTVPCEEQSIQLLESVGLLERIHHKPAQLSGGEQQRLAIARAIANRPGILLADEPTGNLDEETGLKILDLLMELNKTHNLTLILVTHNGHIAREMDSQYVLEQGRLVS